MTKQKPKLRKGAIVQLRYSAAKHCGFRFAEVDQINTDKSIFVSGEPEGDDSWYVGPKGYVVRG